MPNLPDTSGLPVWAQILVSILVCIAALAVAFKGYFGKKDDSAAPVSATVASATLMDNMSMRQLSDQLAHLSADVVSLERAMNDSTHWVRSKYEQDRSKYEQDREICQRLRELREIMERRPG